VLRYGKLGAVWREAGLREYSINARDVERTIIYHVTKHTIVECVYTIS
jgi:hypothetical protein